VPTFIVLDNARIHHGLDETITRQWMEKFHTSLYFLPPYRPELNMIEILWKQAKYHWRTFVTWPKELLRNKISELLHAVGSKFKISFA
jgi:transposase